MRSSAWRDGAFWSEHCQEKHRHCWDGKGTALLGTALIVGAKTSRKSRAKPRKVLLPRLSCAFASCPHPGHCQGALQDGLLLTWKKQHCQGIFCPEITTWVHSWAPKKLAGSFGASAQSRGCCRWREHLGLTVCWFKVSAPRHHCKFRGENQIFKTLPVQFGEQIPSYPFT